MEVNIYICFIFFRVIQSTYGLQCPQCKNVTLDSSSISPDKRLLLSTFERTYSTGECTGGQSSDLETCQDETVMGKITRCGQLVGNLRISINSPLIDKFEFTVNVHTSGCFTVENTLTSGCSSDTSILQQQQHALSQVFGSDSLYEVGTLNGQLCVQAIQSNTVGSGTQNNNNSASHNYFSLWTAILFMLNMFILLA